MKRIIATVAAAAIIALPCLAANEITAQGVLKITKGYLDYTRSVSTTFTITNATPNVAGITQTMYTNGWAELTIGDVSRKGWGWFRNLGSNGNDIAIGPGTTTNNATEFLRIKGGEFSIVQLGTNRIYGMSIGTNEATTVLDKIISDR